MVTCLMMDLKMEEYLLAELLLKNTMELLAMIGMLLV